MRYFVGIVIALQISSVSGAGCEESAADGRYREFLSVVARMTSLDDESITPYLSKAAIVKHREAVEKQRKLLSGETHSDVQWAPGVDRKKFLLGFFRSVRVLPPTASVAFINHEMPLRLEYSWKDEWQKAKREGATQMQVDDIRRKVTLVCEGNWVVDHEEETREHSTFWRQANGQSTSPEKSGTGGWASSY